MTEPDLRALLLLGQQRLPGDAARLEAELLMAHVLGRSRAWMYAHSDAVPTPDESLAFEALVGRRCLGEPVAYLVGQREFWSMPLAVTPDTLIPRADTELLVECALTRIPPNARVRVADLGTGSGAVALAIARERPNCEVFASDISAAALAVALRNAKSLNIMNVEFAQGDWCAALGERSFDVIVSNPPYIRAGDVHLGLGDLRYEPPGALASGVDGLDAIRQIADQSHAYLTDGGWLMLEHGADQGSAVRFTLSQIGYVQIDTCRDLELRERVTQARWLNFI